jgi:hypothetical protein
LSGPQFQHFSYTISCTSITYHTTRCTYMQIWKRVVSYHGFKRSSTWMRQRVTLLRVDQHVFFDILQIPIQCIQICNGWITLTDTPLPMGLVSLRSQGKFAPCYKTISSNTCLELLEACLTVKKQAHIQALQFCADLLTNRPALFLRQELFTIRKKKFTATLHLNFWKPGTYLEPV